MRIPTLWTGALGLVVAVMLAGCGGSDGPTGSPSPSPSPTPTPAPSPGGGGTGGTTITISGNSVSPRTITVPVGTRVTFVNNDNRTHEMNSNPHPEHTDCQAINDVGFIAQSQTKQTGNLTVTRTCGFHDHTQSEVTALQGTIVVQ